MADVPKENGNGNYGTPPLNIFLIKMFLWKENPTADFLRPISRSTDFMRLDFLETKTKNSRNFKKVYNGYTKIWKELNLLWKNMNVIIQNTKLYHLNIHF